MGKSVILVFFILAIFSGFCFYKENEKMNKEYIISLNNYLKDNGVKNLVYNKGSNQINVYKNSINIKESYSMYHITEIQFNLEKEEKNFNIDEFIKFDKNKRIIDNFLFGYYLKKDVANIKILLNKIEGIEIDNQNLIEKYYKEFYPYNVKICDFSYEIREDNKFKDCDYENNVSLEINSKNKKYKILIDNYSNWDLIYSNYFKFSEKGIIEKIKNMDKK